MKSIDNLREYVDKQRDEYNNHNVSFVWQLSTIADEIELEIAERYMLQPVDADGVLIDLGDKLIEHEDGHEFIVDGVKIWGSTYEWWAYEDGGVQAPATRCTHVEPRTLEDVLEDYVIEYQTRHARSEFGAEHFDHVDVHEMVKRCADEIRELLGGDAE